MHIDLKLDLHESLRQAMPMDLSGISQAALQVSVISMSAMILTAITWNTP